MAHTDHPPDEKSVMTYVSSLYEIFPKEPTAQETLHDNVSNIDVIKDTAQLVYLKRLDRGAMHVNASEDHD